MLDFLLAPANLPFAVALTVMLLIGAAEAAGLGGAGVDAGADLETGGGFDPLGWLGIGRLPLLTVLVVLLAAFGLAGIALQQIAAALLGAPLSPWIAAPAAFVAALPLTAAGARVLAQILPRDETTAVGLDSLIAKRATVIVGTARRGSPARARVRDVYGQTHYVMIEPTGDEESLGEGETALLVRREGEIFIGLGEGRTLSAGPDDRPALLG
jgi:hypothetical protein